MCQALLQLREKALKRSKLTEDHILQKIEERTMARKNKEYEKSDAIRKDLAAVGIALMDSPDGTTWRPTIPLALQEQVAATWVSTASTLSFYHCGQNSDFLKLVSPPKQN